MRRAYVTAVVAVCAAVLSGRAAGQIAPVKPSAPPPAETRIAPAKAPEAIVLSRVVAATPADVYRLWATKEGFSEAFGRLLRVELRPGGAYEVEWVPTAPAGERGSEGCTVLSFVPDRMLSFTWNAPPKFGALREERTFVVLTFDPVGPNATRMTLRHMGWKAGEGWPEVRAYFVDAWSYLIGEIEKRFGAASLDAEPAAGQPRTYVYTLRPASRDALKDGGTQATREALGRHVAYLKDLAAKGALIMAGRTTDEEPLGTVIFEAKDDVGARMVMENDPAVRAGVLAAEVRPYRVVLTR